MQSPVPLGENFATAAPGRLAARSRERLRHDPPEVVSRLRFDPRIGFLRGGTGAAWQSCQPPAIPNDVQGRPRFPERNRDSLTAPLRMRNSKQSPRVGGVRVCPLKNGRSQVLWSRSPPESRFGSVPPHCLCRNETSRVINSDIVKKDNIAKLTRHVFGSRFLRKTLLHRHLGVREHVAQDYRRIHLSPCRLHPVSGPRVGPEDVQGHRP